MKRILFSFMLVALLLAAACSNDGEANASDAGETAALPEDVRDIASEISKPMTAAETPAETNDAIFETTGEFVSPSQPSVSPKIPGIVATVHADEGELVRRGAPLATLDTDYLGLGVRRAQAELARARSAEEEAARDLERKRGLRASDSIPQATYDRTLATAEQTAAARQSAETALAVAKQRLSDAVIRSPLTGGVAERRVDPGEYLGDGGVAFVVNQTAPLRLRFSIPGRMLNRVMTGQKVVAVVDPYPGEQFVGAIRTVAFVVDPTSRTIFAEAEFANVDNRLRPGLFARVGLDLAGGGE